MGKLGKMVKALHNGIECDLDKNRAVLFNVDSDDGEQAWVPRSQLEEYDDEEMVLTEYWAEKSGIDHDGI